MEIVKEIAIKIFLEIGKILAKKVLRNFLQKNIKFHKKRVSVDMLCSEQVLFKCTVHFLLLMVIWDFYISFHDGIATLACPVKNNFEWYLLLNAD